MNAVICSGTASLGGILFILDANSTQPVRHGNFYELYGITVVIQVLYNAINVFGIPTSLEFAIIGILILVGVIADELTRHIGAPRWAVRTIDE